MPRHWYDYASIFGSTAPTNDSAERVSVTLGVQFKLTSPGRLVGFRWYRDRNDDGCHFGALREYVGIGTQYGTRLVLATAFHDEPANDAGDNGWRNAFFRPMFRVSVGTLYQYIVHSEKGFWHYTPALYAGADYVNGDITVPPDSGGVFNGIFDYGNPVATAGDGGGNAYGVDVLFLPDSRP